MTTADLIDRLAQGVGPVRTGSLRRDLAIALIAGGAVTVSLVTMVYGVQPGLASVAHGVPLLIKGMYALGLAGVVLVVMPALARPGQPDRGWRLLAVPAIALAGLAAWQLGSAPAADRPVLLLGGSWDRCPWRIVGLSLPVMVSVAIAVRRQAPVRLARAGAAIGLLSGAFAATIYALACTERSAAFVLVWYSLGMGLATAVGALLGPKLLRW